MVVTVKRQLTVALENEPGRLAAISQILSTAGQSIDGLCVVDNIEKGVVRIIVSDANRCQDLLNDQGYYAVESEVLAISVDNIQGIFARVTRALADQQINIDYAYVTALQDAERSLMVMRVSDLTAAERAISALEIPERN